MDTDKTKTLFCFANEPAKQNNPSSLRGVNLDYSRVEIATDEENAGLRIME